MKKNTTPATVPPAPAVPVAPKKIRPADPVLDHKTAKPVTPRRHEKSGRTIGFHQPVSESELSALNSQLSASAPVHLFSPTGNFIETVAAADVAGFEPKPKAKPAEPAPAPVPETPAADAPPAAPETPTAS